MTTDINAIYLRHMDALQLISDTHKHIHSSTMGLSLHLALAELDAAWREMAPKKTLNDCQIEELTYWLDANYRLTTPEEAVAEAIRLLETNQQSQAGAAQLQRNYDRLLAQLMRINDWLAEHAPDEYHQPGDTADAIIAVADRLRGQVAKLRTELAAAIDERNHLDGELRASQNMMNSAHDEAKANAKDAHELRQQLAQLDADNAALIQRNTALAADLATARSYFLNRPTNGHDITDPLSVSAQSAVETRPATQWDDAAMLSGLDAATLDYWHGINAGRWTWRKLPKTVRLAMVRHVLSFTETDAPMSMSQFDAFKPHWMPGAGTHPVTFGVTWATLADLRTEIEVPA